MVLSRRAATVRDGRGSYRLAFSGPDPVIVLAAPGFVYSGGSSH